MTAEEQEALSYQHYCGFWVVPLERGDLAIFDHPNGKLMRVIPYTEHLAMALAGERLAAINRYESKRVAVTNRLVLGGDLPIIDLSMIDL